MSLVMTRAEREEFLAGVHVGIVSVDDPGHGPLSVPVWYAYQPGATVDILTDGQSRKARRMRTAGRFTLCVQTESIPYCYVSVEGPITVIRDTVSSEERRALAYRYLGQELGDRYLAATSDDPSESAVFRMSPERWLSADFSRQFGSPG
jgi:nitroimidazol reductase NimA-like FMN-containing flavoprotein (pyridoxamine 5'-phosphate oxidase superfamily)